MLQSHPVEKLHGDKGLSVPVINLVDCVDWWGGAKRKRRAEGDVAWKVTADEVKARGYNLDFKNPHAIADDHGDPEELLAKR